MKLRAWREDDPAAWDRFVEGAPYRSFAQLWAWGGLRREGGWVPMRLAVGDGPDGDRRIVAGAQILVRRLPFLRTALGYVPRGPVGDLDDPAVWSELMVGLRRVAVAERIVTLRLEPEARRESPVGLRMAARFWRPAAAVQPVTTRILDLTQSEDALRSDLRKKYRQYIGRAERAGIRVERIGPDAQPDEVAKGLKDFHAILTRTADRVGFNTRPLGYYERVWRSLADAGRVRLFFASRDGERLATLFHVSCGDRVAELYGGSTPAGSRERANYLVKWGAALQLKAEGFVSYDLWGQPTPGIAQFKEGFGGEEVRLVGARDLVLDRAGDVAVRLALAARAGAAAARDRLRRPGLPPAGRTDGPRGDVSTQALTAAGARAAGVREATDADGPAWQSLVERSAAGDVLHDWEWAAVAAHDGTPARRFMLEEDGELVAIAAAQVRRTAFGRSFWYVPRGPVLDFDHPRAASRLRTLLAGMEGAARADRAIAIRLEPRIERASVAERLFDASGLRRVEATLQTPDTRLVDLSLDDDALLASFDKDTRYAIRRSAREGVETTVIADPGDETALRELHGIVTETLDRAQYRLPDLERYRLIWRGLAGAGRARIILARHEGRLESAALLVVEGDRSIYLYAGSIREAKGEPKRFASYAAQWRMMRTAREMGAAVHDLWGVAPQDAGPDHPWHGYSLFKKGFDGRFVSWAGSWDAVIDPMAYRLREIASRVRRLGRA